MREKQEGFNVVGYLPATARIALPKPWVALGAHYDHLGRGSHGNSLAAKEDAGKIHYGADDNASGTAAVLAAGRALAKKQRVAARAAGLLVGRGDRPHRLERLRHHAAGAGRSAGRLLQLRHGRPHAGQQAHRAGRGQQPGLAAAHRARQRRRRLRPGAAGRPLPADRRRQLQPRRRAEPGVLHRHARRLPQAQRHRRQDQLRGPRSRRRLRGGARLARRRAARGARLRQGRPERQQGGGRRRACASSPARFPTTPPT